MARCPAHDDRKASLSIATGDSGKILLKCHAGCELDDILASAHLEHTDLFPETTTTTKASIIATYAYHDEGGRHLYDVVRFEPKDFGQRSANGAWSVAGVRRVIYRLDELQGKSVVYVVEGEKDCDRLWAKAIPATTNSGGAGKWKPEYTAQLISAGVERVVVLPDNDDPGRKHADDSRPRV
jgi:putative DNA primase/helicase